MSKALRPTGIETVCFTCGKVVIDFHHLHEGRKLEGYGVTVCNSCYRDNHDGWTPRYGDRLLGYLKDHGLDAPPLAANCLLPREFTPQPRG